MSKIVLLAVLAAWAAVLIPPLLRSRVENRPNSSVTDFRRQLSTLQRAVPTRTMVPMRSMGRPLAPSPLSRPAAPGRPGQMHRSRAARRRRPAHARSHARPHQRPAPSGAPAQGQPARTDPSPSGQHLLHARAGHGRHCFLAATTKANAMVYAFAFAFMSLCGYCYKLVQIRSLEAPRDAETNWFNAAWSLVVGARPRRVQGAAGRSAYSQSAQCALKLRTSPRRWCDEPKAVSRSWSVHDCTATLRVSNGGVAQLAERNNRTVEARGSIPLTSTKWWKFKPMDRSDTKASSGMTGPLMSLGVSGADPEYFVSLRRT